MNIHIETDRLIIRDIEETDVNGFFDLDSDPEVHKYLGNCPITTLDEAKRVIKFIKDQYISNGIGRWAIVDKETNDFIGWGGLKYEQRLRENFSYYDLGYRLKSNYWGKGIGTETALESLKYGFEKLKLNEICAAAHVKNEGSNKILRNVGLSFIETFSLGGDIHNWFKINKSDWEKLKHS